VINVTIGISVSDYEAKGLVYKIPKSSYAKLK